MPDPDHVTAFWEHKRKTIKATSLGGYRSAFTYAISHPKAGLVISRQWFQKAVTQFTDHMSAVKRIQSAEMRAQGTFAYQVGKNHVPMDTYRVLAETSLRLGPGGVLSDGKGGAAERKIPNMADVRHCTSLHLLIVLCWCLCARCDNVVNIHVAQVTVYAATGDWLCLCVPSPDFAAA